MTWPGLAFGDGQGQMREGCPDNLEHGHLRDARRPHPPVGVQKGSRLASGDRAIKTSVGPAPRPAKKRGHRSTSLPSTAEGEAKRTKRSSASSSTAAASQQRCSNSREKASMSTGLPQLSSVHAYEKNQTRRPTALRKPYD